MPLKYSSKTYSKYSNKNTCFVNVGKNVTVVHSSIPSLTIAVSGLLGTRREQINSTSPHPPPPTFSQPLTIFS